MFDKNVFKMSGIKQVFALLVGLAVSQAFFILGQAYFLASVISNLWSGQSFKNQMMPILLFFLCYLCRHLVTFFRDRYLESYARQQSKTLRIELLEKIFRMGPLLIQKHGTGNITTMLIEGIHQVENYLQLILVKIINMSIIPVVLLIGIFILDWESGIVLLLVFPLIIIFMIILGYMAQSKADRQYRTFQILSNHFIDSLRGIDTLQLFGISKKYEKSIYQTSENFRKATISTLKVAILSTFALDFFTTLSVAIVAVLLGLRLLDGNILLFPALTTLILAPEYFLPIRDFASDYHATLDGKNAMAEMGAIISEPEAEIQQISVSNWSAKSQGHFNQLSYNYGENLALSDVSFSISGFQKIGIVGMSGSGKSTLINIISGFFQPTQGEIQLDQVKLGNLSQKDWQKQLAYIPQSPYIYHRSLRENLAFYHPEASDEQLMTVIEQLDLQEFYDELPRGLDTIIGEGERSLSGGQAQRVALARALLDSNRKVLLFDEPTAHLDIETEVALKAKMLPLMANKLVFFATHRLHWMREMDYILVLEHGRLVESGTYNELKAKQGAFARLIQEMRGNQHAED
ncbi:MAG: thiol reductant ABC exporter subunit CydD [Streptococcaceae bacterium]|jgi:ATP-binding cassette subfamily C protein CydD|nr:thiol reductant ABC exporter subunit CydD [Streptococcaceae bacterium]MCH4177046.1 thiol reductant ABC exporter subunit CydD [Streptococcaceae bacterium]